MRDHTQLRAFHLADELAVLTYQCTTTFPKQEQFGITSQIRRAAVSVASNIVEGCARYSEADYLRFLDMAYGSAKELGYQANLAHRLGYLPQPEHDKLHSQAQITAKTLNALIQAIRQSPKSKA